MEDHFYQPVLQSYHNLIIIIVIIIIIAILHWLTFTPRQSIEGSLFHSVRSWRPWRWWKRRWFLWTWWRKRRQQEEEQGWQPWQMNWLWHSGCHLAYKVVDTVFKTFPHYLLLAHYLFPMSLSGLLLLSWNALHNAQTGSTVHTVTRDSICINYQAWVKPKTLDTGNIIIFPTTWCFLQTCHSFHHIQNKF